MQLRRNLPVRAASAALLLSAAAAAQVPVDLNTWSDESYPAVSGFGAGVWTVAPDGSSVNQSVNGQPTLFYSDFNVFNTEVEGQITVGGGDDDFVGFVLGYGPGDANNPGADYLLVDWKRGTQEFDFAAPSCTPTSTAPAGLAVSRVTGIPTADEFWGHTDFDATCSGLGTGLQELARATNLGATGWAVAQTYTFRFEFNSTSLRVFVDGVLELDIAGAFADGRMGFYNFSQANVTYNAFTLDCAASATTYGAGWQGTLGVPSLTASAAPVLGTTIQLQLSNAAGVETYGCLFTSGAEAQTATVYGGTLLVSEPFGYEFPIHPLPPGGAAIAYTVPDEITLCGVDFYSQWVHLDAGATSGVAFSPGLRLRHGL